VNRSLANVFIDLAAALLFVAMVATGYILHFPLPPGTNRTLSMWGLTRHQWGDIHYWISLALLAIVAIHLVLHWNWVVTVVGKRLRLVRQPHPSMLRSGMLVIGVLVAAFSLFAFAAHLGVQELAEPLHELEQSNDNEAGKINPPQNLTTESTAGGIASWENVYSIFENRCISCHGPKRQLGDFRVDQRECFFGDDGKRPLIVPGNAVKSPLIAIVSGARPEMRMADKHRLPEHEVSLLTSWIDAGANWPDLQK
jgi:hypothetical protein